MNRLDDFSVFFDIKIIRDFFVPKSGTLLKYGIHNLITYLISSKRIQLIKVVRLCTYIDMCEKKNNFHFFWKVIKNNSKLFINQ